MRSEAASEELAGAIRKTQDGEPRLVEAVPVHETFEGQTVWEGVVHVLDLTAHAIATRAYAWSHKIEGIDGERYLVSRSTNLRSIRHRPPCERRSYKRRGRGTSANE